MIAVKAAGLLMVAGVTLFALSVLALAGLAMVAESFLDSDEGDS